MQYLNYNSAFKNEKLEQNNILLFKKMTLIGFEILQLKSMYGDKTRKVQAFYGAWNGEEMKRKLYDRDQCKGGLSHLSFTAHSQFTMERKFFSQRLRSESALLFFTLWLSFQTELKSQSLQ